MKDKFNNHDLKNPDNYKWGIFYFNRNDNRVFVPKQQWGLGYTLNFGNPFAQLIILALAAAIIIIEILF